MPKLNVLVAGSTGYIGIQLIKLLNKHKYVKIKYLCGNTSVGKKISYYDKTIGLKRLMARPVAKYTIAAQEKHEKDEKVHADD